MALADPPGGGGGPLAAPAGRVERATSNINVPTFNSLNDDFEEWVELFEKAVMLATNVREDASLHFLYKEWLPLKLDNSARATLKQVAGRAWPELKAQLTLLLVDPQEQARWQAKKTTIKWDGKESFHNLASRVKRAVDKYERGMPDEFKQREYFQCFKNAFKKPMRRVIAFGCPEGGRTIEAAKEVALRFHIANAEDNEDSDGAKDNGKSSMFASGSFPSDRATRIESALADITAQIDDISLTVRDQEARFCSIEDRLTALERRGDRDRNRYDDWDDSQGQINDRDDYQDSDWPDSQEQYDYPLRYSDGGRHPSLLGDPMHDRRNCSKQDWYRGYDSHQSKRYSGSNEQHSHHVSSRISGQLTQRKNGQPNDGEYRAMNTGNKYNGSDNCQYQTAFSKMRGGKDTRSSHK